MICRIFVFLIIFFLFTACEKDSSIKNSVEDPLEIIDIIDVDFCASDFSVSFGLFTQGEDQFVAYYDTNHVMKVASRKTYEKKWNYQTLNSHVNWDSHNYISIHIDSNGIIHLSGNMHVSPLVYYKSHEPLDIFSLEIAEMIGRDETEVTYPVFMKGPDNSLIFHYRNGISGRGCEIFNSWNQKNGKWERLLDVPIIDGEGLRNAYLQGPLLGPDNYYHLIWVWRDSPDCSTNHNLSYAKSKDLLKWESIRGEVVTLPILFSDTFLVVDDVPSGGGLLNIGIKLGFYKNSPLIAYHKYDENGNTQIYLSRYESQNWVNKKITDGNWRWDFSGTGSIVNELELYSLNNLEEFIFLVFNKQRQGLRSYIINDAFEIINEDLYYEYPPIVDKLSTNFPEMIVHKAFDSNDVERDTTYFLRWEALGVNRDEKPDKAPPHSKLQIYKMRK